MFFFYLACFNVLQGICEISIGDGEQFVAVTDIANRIEVKYLKLPLNRGKQSSLGIHLSKKVSFASGFFADVIGI